MIQYGNKAKLFTYRILDELLIKEARAFQNSTQQVDFSHLLLKEIFLKSVFVCAMETVFFIGTERHV